jgi:hypothetical protein
MDGSFGYMPCASGEKPKACIIGSIETDNGRSALAAATGLHAPLATLLADGETDSPGQKTAVAEPARSVARNGLVLSPSLERGAASP